MRNDFRLSFLLILLILLSQGYEVSAWIFYLCVEGDLLTGSRLVY